jgi:hypothetical protein
MAEGSKGILKADAFALVTAATVASAYRLYTFTHPVQSAKRDGRHFYNALRTLGLSVVVLEMVIVMLRYFTVMWVIRTLVSTTFWPHQMRLSSRPWLVVVLGILVTFILAVIPKAVQQLVTGGQNSTHENEAVQYLMNRPFELAPVFVEYAVLYLAVRHMHSPMFKMYVLCNSVLALMLMVHEHDDR